MMILLNALWIQAAVGFHTGQFAMCDSCIDVTSAIGGFDGVYKMQDELKNGQPQWSWEYFNATQRTRSFYWTPFGSGGYWTIEADNVTDTILTFFTGADAGLPDEIDTWSVVTQPRTLVRETLILLMCEVCPGETAEPTPMPVVPPTVSPTPEPSVAPTVCSEITGGKDCTRTANCVWKKAQGCKDPADGPDPVPSCSDIKKGKECAAAPNCEWNKRKRACAEPGADPEPAPACSDIKKAKACKQASDCEWQKAEKICTEPGYEPPAPACSDLKRAKSCSKAKDCTWDKRAKKCGDAGAAPGPAPEPVCADMKKGKQCLSANCKWDKKARTCSE